MTYYLIQRKILLIQDHLAVLYARKKGHLVEESSFKLDCLDQSTFNKALSNGVTVLVDDTAQTFLRGILPRVGYFERKKLVQNTLNAMHGTLPSIGGVTWRSAQSTKLQFNAYSFSQPSLFHWLLKLTESGVAISGVYSFPFAIKDFLKAFLGKNNPSTLLLVFENNDSIDVLALDSNDILLRRRISKTMPSCKNDLSETFIHIQRSHCIPSTLWSVYDLTQTPELNISRILESSGLPYKMEGHLKQENHCTFKTTLLHWMIRHNQFGPRAEGVQLKTATLRHRVKRSMGWAITFIGGASAVSCVAFSIFSWQAHKTYELNLVHYETLLRSFNKTSVPLDMLKLARLKIDPLYDFKKISRHPVQPLQLEHLEWHNVELLSHRDQAFMILRGTLLTGTEVSFDLASLKDSFSDSTVRYGRPQGHLKDATSLLEGKWFSPLISHKENESTQLTREITIEIQR